MAAGNNITEKIENILRSKQTLNAKLVELGIATETDNLSSMVSKANTSIVNQGAVQLSVKEGQSITIPKGYHNGSGTVTALSDVVSDEQKYNRQAKTATPTKEQQNITPDEGYYALSSVTINPIPSAYQDVTPVTITSSKFVLAGYVYVDSKGGATVGTMSNNGKVTATIKGLTTLTSTYTIPEGYHDGTGTVSLTKDIENLLAEI